MLCFAFVVHMLPFPKQKGCSSFFQVWDIFAVLFFHYFHLNSFHVKIQTFLCSIVLYFPIYTAKNLLDMHKILNNGCKMKEKRIEC